MNECRIAGGMPIAIVHILEAIDVEQHHGQGAAVAARDPDENVELFIEPPTVGQAGQGIGPRLVKRLFKPPLLLKTLSMDTPSREDRAQPEPRRKSTQ